MPAASRAVRACRWPAAPQPRASCRRHRSRPARPRRRLERPHRGAAPDGDPAPRRLVQQQLVQPAARQAPGGERQAGGRHGAPGDQPDRARSARHPAWPSCRSSAASSAAASPLRNSPQTLSCGPRSRSSSDHASAGHGQPGGGGRAPASPPPATATSQLMPWPTVRKRIASAVRPGPERQRAARPRRPAPRQHPRQDEHHGGRAHIAVVAQHRARIGERAHRPAAGRPGPRRGRCARPDGPPTARPRRGRARPAACRSGAAGRGRSCPARHRRATSGSRCRRCAR